MGPNMFKNLNQYLSLNILAFAAYPAIYTFIRIFKNLLLGDIYANFIYYLIVGYYILIIFITVTIFIAEQITKKKILQNKNFLQNTLYNIFFNIGLIFSTLFICFDFTMTIRSIFRYFTSL